MRHLATLFAVITIAAALAGCGTTAPPSASELQTHTTSLAAVSGMSYLPIGAAATEFKGYGMTTNPDAADPANFPNFKGAVPTAAYGEILQEGSNTQHRLYVFALGFPDSAAARAYLDDGKACGNPGARAYTQADTIITQFVYVSLDSAADGALVQHWHDAIQDVMTRTGAVRACGAS